MADIKNWSTTAASNNSAAPNGWPESTMKVNEVNDTGRQMMADIRSWYEDSQWIDFGHTPTRTGATTFTVSGTHTGIYSADRAIRATDASTLYGVVSDSTHSGGTTTVTVSLDAGSLTGSLSAVAVGALTADSATAMPGGSTVRVRLGLGDAASKDVGTAGGVQSYDADILKADTTDNLEAGYTASIDTNIGTVTSGTVTPDETASNWFKYTNNGAHVLAPPSITAGTAVVIYVDITNAASAGAITTSSFDVIEGDSFDTVNGNKFQCTVSVSDIGSRLFIRAMQ